MLRNKAADKDFDAAMLAGIEAALSSAVEAGVQSRICGHVRFVLLAAGREFGNGEEVSRAIKASSGLTHVHIGVSQPRTLESNRRGHSLGMSDLGDDSVDDYSSDELAMASKVFDLPYSLNLLK